jgi:hypothetical protein
MWLLNWSGRRPLESGSSRAIPESPGVYLLWSREPGGAGECLHVGQAENLRRRLSDHAGEQGAADYQYALLPHPKLRQDAERFLRYWYGRESGEPEPDSSALPVNLPS